MISVGSRDGRKGLGLEFGAGGEMEETELEEGEACCYQNDKDTSIDPDIDLSYIDEKLKDVLGHFQKDFEGGVSAENLGPKFGGYGSFLPTYQRSPVWCGPPKVHSNNVPGSPNSLPQEAGHHNSACSTSSSLAARPGSTFVNCAPLSAPGAPLMNEAVKQGLDISSTIAEERTLKSELVTKSAYPSDLKTLKLRIKVGSDNLSTQKNAEIYSGLGLDVSPSSSLEDNPEESDGLSLEADCSLDESPTSIVQNMTSFPVHGSLLLSPLPDDLVCLTEKAKIQGGSGFQTNSVNNDHKVLQERKLKLSEKNVFSTKMKNGDEAQNGTGGVLKKLFDSDTLACEELVSNTLKLPLLSNSNCSSADSVAGTGKAVNTSYIDNKGDAKREHLAKEEYVDPLSTEGVGQIGNPDENAGLVIKGWDTVREISQDGTDSIHPRKGANLKEGNYNGTAKADSNIPKKKKSLNTELIGHTKQQTSQKATALEEKGMKLGSVKEHSSSGSKKKSKGSQSHHSQSIEGKNSSSFPDRYKNTPTKNSTSQNETEGKARDRYVEFFGDLELEEGIDEIISEEMPSAEMHRECELVKKSAREFKSISIERSRVQEIDEPSTSEAYPRARSNVHPSCGNGLTADSATVTVDLPPEDNWVCCDKCQKWRLLPLGTNPDSLPEKWLCSMLNWLPGMNRCAVTEEETTKALVASYQVTAPENRVNQHSHCGNVLPGLPSRAAHFDQRHQPDDLGMGPIGARKKHGSHHLPNAPNQSSPGQFFNHDKKNSRASLKSRSSNDMNYSSAVDEDNFQHLDQSVNLVAEKQRHKQRDKKKLHESYSEGGYTKKSKSRNKRETDQDFSTSSKKIKKDGVHCSNEGLISDHGETILKDDPNSGSCLPIHASGKECHKFSDGSTDSKYDVKEQLCISVRDTENQMQFTLDDKPMHMGKCNNKDAKKRKLIECQDTLTYSIPLPGSGHCLQECRDFMEENNGSGYRKDRKARLAKHEGKETMMSKAHVATDKHVRSMMDQHLRPQIGNSLSQQSLDALDSVKRDFGSVHNPVAANSSSSKVSGSHKYKTNLHEVKGSPVESVSSSPVRYLNSENFTSKKGDHLRNVDSNDTAFVASASPKRCSDGEDEGRSDRSGTERKDETCTATHHESLVSSELNFQGRDLVSKFGKKMKTKIVSSSELSNRDVTSGDLGHDMQFICNLHTSDRGIDEKRGDNNIYQASGPRPRKSNKNSSSRSKDKNQSYESELENCKVNTFDSFSESVNHASSYVENSRSGRNKFQDKFGINSDKIEKKFAPKKGSSGKLSSESRKRDNKMNSGGAVVTNIRVDNLSSQEQKNKILLGHDAEKSSKRFTSEKADQIELSGRGKSHALPPSGRCLNEALPHCPEPILEPQKQNRSNILLIDGSEGDAAPKAQNQNKKAESQNGNQPTNSKNLTPNGHRPRDAPSPLRRDSSSQAASNAVKEAKDLKHLADRLKNSGSSLESTGLYFQAALKFLHGASLLESGNKENDTKHGEMIQSMRMYSSTAKLCEFCAHEYEKSKDMASAALAYKCMEVAYLRVVYSSHNSASKDRHELQTALLIVPPGESPSSSASDVDNLNNPATVDKAALPKGVCSPQVAGNHVISARNRSSFLRMLNFTQDVHFAMEASKKSRIAFAATNTRLEQNQFRDGIPSVKKALDFNFQDVEGLLRLVRLAMEAISR